MKVFDNLSSCSNRINGKLQKSDITTLQTIEERNDGYFMEFRNFIDTLSPKGKETGVIIKRNFKMAFSYGQDSFMEPCEMLKLIKEFENDMEILINDRMVKINALFYPVCFGVSLSDLIRTVGFGTFYRTSFHGKGEWYYLGKTDFSSDSAILIAEHMPFVGTEVFEYLNNVFMD